MTRAKAPTKKLSRAQVEGLRYARRGHLYARDINEGDGNVRRTLLWLIDRGFLTWDTIYHGRVVITELGEQALLRADPPGTLRIRDVGDRRVITLTGVHDASDKERS